MSTEQILDNWHDNSIRKEPELKLQQMYNLAWTHQEEIQKSRNYGG